LFLIYLLAAAIFAVASHSARAQQPAGDGLPPAPFGPQPKRAPIMVGLPTQQTDDSGGLAIKPNVTIDGPRPQEAAPKLDAAGNEWPVTTLIKGSFTKWMLGPDAAAMSDEPMPGVVLAGANMPAPRATPVSQATTGPPPTGMPLPDPLAPGTEELPSGAPLAAPPQAAPMFAQSLADGCGCGPPCGAVHGHHDGTFYGLGGFEEGPGDPGIGHERVMHALFEIPDSQPYSNMRFRFNAAYNQRNPDRADFFWAQIGGRGPKLPEHSVDYQDLIASWEVASGKAFSITTDIPLRFVAPDINPNTGGLGDMAITTKTVLLDGADWEITQYFRTELPTGDPGRGTGNGHTSLEPGFLFRLRWSPETYFLGQLTYWFPLGDNPVYGGQILKYGIGVSHLLYENDAFAVIPTLEFNGWTVLNGAQTTFPIPTIQPVDTMGIFNVRPGLRFVRDTGGDLGLFEWGVSGSFALTTNKWYEASWLLEARFVF
jgi:hypothetical protein